MAKAIEKANKLLESSDRINAKSLVLKEKMNINSKQNFGEITIVLKNLGTNRTQMDMVQALNNLTQVMTFVFTYGVANNNHETKHI
jgi:hypothetical protein